MTEMVFVESDDSSVIGFGIGKLVDCDESPGLIHYFVSPAEGATERLVDPGSIREVELQPQERIFYVEDGAWCVGRLQGYLGPKDLALRLPNQQVGSVGVQDAYVRSNLPIESPLGLLQTRNTETAFWHEGRAALVRGLASQRAAYHGLTGLASANVELFRHQLEVARRVLNDPIPRYLLADEVGLGKTIEVGIIVRQHLLDDPAASKVLIVVPEHLVLQWESELERLFHAVRVKIVAHNDKRLLKELASSITLLVVDEAHHLAQHAYDKGDEGAYYRAISRLAQKSKGVLLLSATPVVHNEDAFLGMLHLLDPAAHSLDARDSFRERIEHREVIAGAVRDLEDDASSFFIEPALQDIRPLAARNPRLAGLIDAVEELIGTPDDPKRAGAISSLRSHLQETYRLDRRLLRTRRAQSGVCEDLPKREHQIWPQQDPGRIEVFEWLDQWRFSAADTARSKECADTMFEFLDAAFRHPVLLAQVISARCTALKQGTTPYFDGEADFLLCAPQPFSVSDDPRVQALEVVLRDTAARDQKWVVFVSDVGVADEVSTILSRSFNVLRLEAGEVASETVEEFRGDKEIRALVCDESGEDGLNLQGVGAKILHFDLPLAANRIEQRIGRLDRLRGDPTIMSLVPVLQAKTGYANYEGAWAECLIRAVQVFDRSVASLQHALDAGRRRMLGSLVDGGVEAISDLSEEWLSADGELSLGRELRRIESQDLLDQLEALRRTRRVRIRSQSCRAVFTRSMRLGLAESRVSPARRCERCNRVREDPKYSDGK
jgi:ATP-dependent helicase HepA